MSSIEALINRQFMLWERTGRRHPTRTDHLDPLPIITVSRQRGSRGSYFASRLAERLGYQRLHREVIDAICESSGYRKRVVESLDEHLRGDLELAVESIFTGQSIDHSDYARHLVRVILSMAKLGGVVVTGRAANFILGLNQGVHFRIVAPYKARLNFLMEYAHLTRADGVTSIDSADKERGELVRGLFGRDINDPQYYDVVYNSAFIDIEEMLDSAMLAIRSKLEKLRHSSDRPRNNPLRRAN